MSFELPDIITELQDETGLTRRTIVDMLLGSNRLNEFLKNPYNYIKVVKAAIKSVLADVVIDGIKYEKIADEIYELREFQRESEDESERFIDRLYEVKDSQKSIIDKLAKIRCASEHFAAIGMNDYAKSTPEDWRV